MRANDPSLDKLQSYISSYFPELRSAERGQAIFWFALHYNRGAGTELHKAIQAFAFSGVPLLPAPERGDPAWQPYQMLSVTYAPFGRPQSPNKPDKAEKQHKPKAKRVRRCKLCGNPVNHPDHLWHVRKDDAALPMPTLLGVDWFMIHFTKGWTNAMDGGGT